MKQPRFIVLFGSAAKGTMKDSSDVDVAVLQDHNIPFTYNDYYALYKTVQSLYETNDRRVDLVDLATANPLLRYEAVMQGKLLQGDELDFAEYKLFAFKDYVASQSLFDLEKKLIAKRQQFLAKAIAPAV